MSSRELDDIVLAYTSDMLLQNIDSSITFEKSIQQARFTLVTSVRNSSSRISLSHRVELKQGSKLRSKTPWKALFSRRKIKMVKRGHFEVLRKKSSTMTDVVWPEESKNGLRFEIGPRQQKL